MLSDRSCLLVAACEADDNVITRRSTVRQGPWSIMEPCLRQSGKGLERSEHKGRFSFSGEPSQRNRAGCLGGSDKRCSSGNSKPPAPTDSMVANITPYLPKKTGATRSTTTFGRHRSKRALLQASIVTASSRECQPPFGVDACATAS